MSILVLVRHGQSTWNLEKRFTGWVDVDLTIKGKSEAEKAGLLLKNRGIEINFYYSSLQLRANHTLKIIQKVLKKKENFTRAWQLNERHYGALTGLNKIEMSKKIGEDKVYEFRRSWNIRPEALDRENKFHPLNIKTYKDIPKKMIPDAESLKDTYDRVIKYFNEEIRDKLKDSNILISAHGNSIRALCKNLFNLNDIQISQLEIPTGNPLIIEFNSQNKIILCEYLDYDRAKDLVVF